MQLGALLFWLIFLFAAPQLLLDWRFLVTFAGPLAFWTAVVTILVRLRRSGYRPRFHFGRPLTISGSRDCYDAYVKRFGRDLFIWTIPGSVLWSIVWFFLAA